MAKSRAERRLADLDAVVNALAHPARRQILMTIYLRGGNVPAGDIAARFRHSWPTTTRHLKVLEEAGLIRAKPHGRLRNYSVATEKLDVLREWLDWFDASRK